MTTADLRAVDWSGAAVRHACERTDLQRVQRGVYVVGGPTEPDARPQVDAEAANLRAARGAAKLCTRGVISHVSAAVSHGLPVYGDLRRACLTVPAGTALRNLANVHLHRAALAPEDVVEVDGYRVTTVARSVTDVARERGVPSGLIAADYALHEGLTDRDALRDALRQCSGWPGRRAARVAVGLADANAESPLESLSRLAILSRRLPRPVLQPTICDQHGHIIGRPDLYWDEFGVVGECDGNLKYVAGGAALLDERRRHADFDATGLLVVRWGWRDLFDFDPVAARLETAFTRGARPGSPHRRWGVVALHP